MADKREVIHSFIGILSLNINRKMLKYAIEKREQRHSNYKKII